MKPTISHIISGYLLEAEARRLSPHTLSDYQIAFRRLVKWLGRDKVFAEITVKDLRTFFAHLAGDEFKPVGCAAPRKAVKLSNKTILNHHTSLSALWTFAVDNGFAEEHLLRKIPRPKPEKTQIVPYSMADIQALLDACRDTRAYIHHQSNSPTRNTRQTAERDEAILLLLLDTGIRASELCGLRLKDLDLKNATITVTGKGKKTRTIPLSERTWKALWKYILLERENAKDSAPVFLSFRGGRPLSRGALGKLIKSLGEKANVADARPHRFRHTFAIFFLRNGGNVYALQSILGHTTLEMIKTYLALAQADVEEAHKQASPVGNLQF